MRFNFGKNWQSFSKTALDDEKINQARNDFQNLFSGIDLKDKSFLDIGFGQGPETRFISILDDEFSDGKISQTKYDIVHSWGVLHHTGRMYEAITNASNLVGTGGYFVISIYNKHWSSSAWKWIKWSYNKSPTSVQKLLIRFFYLIIYVAKLIVTGKDPLNEQRGMDFLHNVVDWIGGYPYEYAGRERITKFVNKLGFETLKINPAYVPTGCNEFVFRKN